MSRKRTVIGITGIRSEYFLQKSLFKAIKDHLNLELKLIVTGAHLSPIHNYSVDSITADGFEIFEKVESLLWSNSDGGRLKSAAMQMQTLAHIFERERPDWVIAPCDREEALTTAICASYLNIPIAHLAAGDRVVGNVDDMVRHAVSKLSHLLLTTNEDAKKRLLQSGEQEFRVFNVGHPGLDRIREAPSIDIADIAEKFAIKQDMQQFLMVIQHVISSEIDQASSQMEETMKALEKIGLPAIVVYPNSDPGCQDIISVINSYCDKCDHIYCFDTIQDDIFINLLRKAFALIGNSSLGLLEAPFLQLPVINVGNRQQQRFHAENVVFVPHNAQLIADTIQLWLQNDEEWHQHANCENPFGDGHTGVRVAELLDTIDLDANFLNKDLTY
ncbi:MAG: UDP-N-acetylglucosamine 2-epimerase [Desulfobulbaceae bacterium]|nr:UDP-N-acetylglucosamine 2-epimerase [Desulfobulbaceae bacterium]